MSVQYCALDFETTRIKENNRVDAILGYAWTIHDGNGGYKTESTEWHPSNTEHLQYLIDNYTLVFHSAQFELYVLEKFLGLKVRAFHDTQVMGYIWNPATPEVAVRKNGKVSMQQFTLAAWGVRLGSHKLSNDEFDWTAWSDEMATYCRQDAELTLKLFDYLEPLLRSDSIAWQCYDEIDRPFIRAIVEMQQNGLRFDRAALDEFINKRKARCEELTKEILVICPIAPGKSVKFKRPKSEAECERKLGGYFFIGIEQEEDTRKCAKPGDMVDVYKYRKWEQFNPGSPSQVAWALTDLYGWEPEKLTDTGSPATGGDVLEELTYPLASLLCEYSHEEKLVSSFGDKLIEKMDAENIVYPSVHNTVTLTGRLSSSQP